MLHDAIGRYKRISDMRIFGKEISIREFGIFINKVKTKRSELSLRTKDNILFESMFEFASSIHFEDAMQVLWYFSFEIFYAFFPQWFKPLTIFSLFSTSFEKLDSPGLNRYEKL